MKIKHIGEFKFLYNLLEKYIMRFINKIIFASVAAVVLAGCGSEKQTETQTETTETTSAPVVNNDEESGKHALVEECQAKNNDLETKILAADEALKKADAQFAALKAELVKEKARTDELKKAAIKMEEEYVVDGLMNLPVEEAKEVTERRAQRLEQAKKHGFTRNPVAERAAVVAEYQQVTAELGREGNSEGKQQKLIKKQQELVEKYRFLESIITELPVRNIAKAFFGVLRKAVNERLANRKALQRKLYDQIYALQKTKQPVPSALTQHAVRVADEVKALEARKAEFLELKN